MNITVVCDVLGDETNGTTVAAMNLIRHLQQSKHNVKILCADESKRGVENYYVASTLSLGPFDGIVRKNNVVLAKPQQEVLEEALKDADHVHIMLPFALGISAMKYAREHGISTTAGFHAQAENLSSHVRLHKVAFVNHAIYKFFYNHFYGYVNGIHYPTQFIRDDFEGDVKKTTPGYVISNGVNGFFHKQQIEKPEEFKDKIVILSAGRYSVEKNQETLIKAVSFSKYKDKIQLILAGQGPLTNKFKKLCKKYAPSTIMKIYPRDELANVLNMCDIYAHPAVVELEGIACLEAICVGKCVIVSDSERSATKNFAVDDRCIFKNKNPKDLARAIDYFIENPDVRESCGEKYMQSAHLYNQEECMQKMEQMIEEVHEKFLQEQAAAAEESVKPAV